MHKTCVNCAFARMQIETSSDGGEAAPGAMNCYQKPPSVQLVPVPVPGGVSMRVISMRPTVYAGDTCGYHWRDEKSIDVPRGSLAP